MKILYQGKHVATVGHVISLDEAVHLLSEPDENGQPTRKIDPAQVSLVAESGEEIKQVVRRSIHHHAGDPESLLGTVADVAQMLLVWHCELVEAAKNATNLAQLKAAITNSPLGAETARLVADTKAGNTRWPFQLKGAAQVADDVERRATVAHDAIKAGPKAALK